MDYNKYNLNLLSDYEIRIVREDEKDIDIIIPLEDRTLNINFYDMPHYISNRFQYSSVKNILIRLSKLDTINTCTIHLLRTIDLGSSLVNFELDYNDNILEIRNKEYFIDMYIKEGGLK